MGKKVTRIGCFRIASKIERAIAEAQDAKSKVERGLQFSHVSETAYRDGARGGITSARTAVTRARGLGVNGLVRSHLSRSIRFLDEAKKCIPRKKKHALWTIAGDKIVEAMGALNEAFTAAETKCLKGW